MAEPEFIDMTGKPRSDRELEEAIQVVGKFIVKGILSLPPELALQLGVIRGLLLELQAIRAVIQAGKGRKP